MSADSHKPLILTRSPKLDAAIQAGWEAWESAARDVGAEAVAAWLGRRIGDPEVRGFALPIVQDLLEAEDDEERYEAWIELTELAELAEGTDDLLADTLWEGILAAGCATDDPDVIFEATTRLAAIAEAHGDPLAAAEYYIDFLNWRRQPGHASDPEEVETAFDEIVRLATQDGAQKEAAVYGYRQAGFTRWLDADDDRAVIGDWESDPAPYESWA